MINLNEMLGKALRPAHASRAAHRAARPTTSWWRRRATSCSTRTSWCRMRCAASRTTASSSSTRSTRSARARRRPHRRRRVAAKACSATCCRCSKAPRSSTKYGPVKTDHVLFIASGAFHARQAVRPAARAAGAAADPRGAEAADAGGFPPHPDRAGGEPDQAVRGADGRPRA